MESYNDSRDPRQQDNKPVNKLIKSDPVNIKYHV